MPTTYPTSLDSFSNPGAATLEDAAGFYHDEQHANANDAVEALQAKVGISEPSAQDAPLAGTVLASSTNGRSKWRPLAGTDFAAGQAMTLLASQAPIGTTQAEFDITGISQAYKALRLYLVLRSNVAAVTDTVTLKINGLATFYQWIQLLGTNTAASSTGAVADTKGQLGGCPGASATASLRGIIVVELPGYAVAGTLKSWSATGGLAWGTTATELHARLNYGVQANDAAAITRIQVGVGGGTLGVGASFALYGMQ